MMKKKLVYDNKFIEEMKKFKKEKDSNFYYDVTTGNSYKTNFLEYIHGETNFTITYNSDGISVFKKSNYSIVPTFISFNELELREQYNMKNIFLIALLTKSNNYDFIKRYIFHKLKEIEVDNGCEKFKFRISRLILDTPARSSLLKISDSGYNFCHICKIKGVYLNNKVVYPEEHVQHYTRADMNQIMEQIRNGEQTNGNYDFFIYNIN